MFDLILHGGTLISPHNKTKADIAVKAGKIAAIGSEIPQMGSAKTIDVSGKYIFPGCIDSHMHLWEPGQIAHYDFSDGTRGSAAQGVTTVIDHPLTIPEVLNADIFREKVGIGERTSYTDFALHAGIGQDNFSEIEALWEAGCTAFKIFMCESGSRVNGQDSGRMLEALQRIGKLGGTVVLHCENNEMLNFNEMKLRNTGRKDMQAFLEWRPPIVETEAIHRALFLLRDTGTRAVFAHTTVPEGVAMISRARESGLDVWTETCAHNLYLTTEDLSEKGAWVSYAPPVRDPKRLCGLWECLKRGEIQTVGSDHCSVDPELKRKAETDMWEHLFGVPDGETLVPLMLNAVATGRISAEKMSEVLSANPAKIYGLYPRKGVIAIGSDADFTIADMETEYTLQAENMYTACKWIPYEGMRVKGQVAYTILRGKVISERGRITGEPGDGKFYRREFNNQ